jgi:hypothetical protein
MDIQEIYNIYNIMVNQNILESNLHGSKVGIKSQVKTSHCHLWCCDGADIASRRACCRGGCADAPPHRDSGVFWLEHIEIMGGFRIRHRILYISHTPLIILCPQRAALPHGQPHSPPQFYSVCMAERGVVWGAGQ